MKYYFYSFTILSFVLIFSACKKQTGNVYLPYEGTQTFDGYGFTDSLTLITSTIREDSLKTDSLSHNIVGIINDPVFGQYKASAFIQYQIPQFGNVLSGNLDSVVIFMQYTSPTAYYGDLSATTEFNVYELNEDMGKTKTHSNSGYTYNSTIAGTFNGKFKVADSITISELGKDIRIAPTLRIVLPKTNPLALKLFGATSADLSSQASFLQFFKGLAIVPSTIPAVGSGVIAAFNMKSDFSKIRIYYNDSLQSDFKIFTDSRRLNKYEISNQANEIMKQKTASSSANFDTAYIQAMTGAKMKIQIPYLFSLIKPGKHVAIAKAEMIIRPRAGTYNSPFPLPSRLLLLQPDKETGLNAGIVDLLEPFYGGNYNASLNEYRFNITRHIQNLFIDYQSDGVNNNNGLFVLIPTDYPVAPSRIYVDARKKMPDAGIEFKLYYAEL